MKLEGRCAEGLSESVETCVTRDRATMLYAHARAGIFASALVSTLLVLTVAPSGGRHRFMLWLAAMQVVQAVRLLDLLLWHRRPRRTFNGPRRIVRFSVGAMASAAVWAAFPVLFFHLLPQGARMAALVTFSAMASGSATVLAPSLTLAISYAVTLIVPASLVMLTSPGQEDMLLGTLSILYCVVLVVSSRIAHQSSVGALRLGRENERLVLHTDMQRRQTEATNQELGTAKQALAESNQLLETRVQQRTAELANEVLMREQYAEALARLASTDPLTGLCNRTTFTERLARLLAVAEQAKVQVAVLFLDLDNFKQINDVRGHATGDQVLQAVAGVLGKEVTTGAEIARWGGDEFLVAVHVADCEAAADIAQHLRDALAEPLEIGIDTVRVEATIGVALFPKDATTQDELIRAADVAMYEAKREGKGRVKLFDPALASDMAERFALEQGLRHALARQELSLAFQPIVAARTGRTYAFEALLRWRHPDRGMVSPMDFIPIAEQTGQIHEISCWVLREACTQAAGWPDATIAVTVNISVAHVLTGTLIADVEAALAASGLAPYRLQLEITESMFLGDHVRAAPVFEALRARGIRILLDDFGTGYSSLAYLGRLPVDVIKIDRSFVINAERDGYATIEAILSLARALGMEVTAEGVETKVQRDTLRKRGVTRFQGYLFSRPIPAAEVEAWLRRDDPGADAQTPAARTLVPTGTRTQFEARTPVEA